MKNASKFYGVIIAVACCAFVITGQTSTDVNGWQEARWGMTEDEVLDVFKSRTTKLSERQTLVDNKGYADYAIQDYEIEGNKFTVFFDMNPSKKLMRIRMSLNDDKSIIPKDALYFPPYESLLTRKYGPPSYKNDERSRNMVTLKRQWAFKTTTIELLYVWSRMGNFNWLRIEYFPSKSGDLEKL